MTNKIAIVTDSTADIPRDVCSELNITVIPNIVIMDGESYRDDVDITREEFYKRLPEVHSPPTTSTGSLGTYQKVYDKLLNNGAKSILSIHLSSTLSSVFNTATIAAREFEGIVHVFDSKQLTLGLGFQVIEAAKAAKSGKSLDSIFEIVEKMRQKARVFAMLDTLEYIRRSGRVSWARAKIGALLRYKQFVEVNDGDVFSLSKVRTRKKGIQHLLSLIQQQNELTYLAILHTNAEKDAREILTQVKNRIDHRPFIINVTTVIGTHVGPNGLGFAAVLK